MLKPEHTHSFAMGKINHSESLNKGENHTSTFDHLEKVCLLNNKQNDSRQQNSLNGLPLESHWDFVVNSFTEPQHWVKDSLLGPRRMTDGSFFIRTNPGTFPFFNVTNCLFSRSKDDKLEKTQWLLETRTWIECWHLTMALVVTKYTSFQILRSSPPK